MSATVPGHYFDGKSSARHDALIGFEAPGWLTVSTTEGAALRFAFQQVEVSPRIGNTRRVLQFPDGSVCETAANDVVDAWLAALGKDGWKRRVHMLESGYRYALLAALVMLVLVGTGLVWGIPALARQAAFALPPAVEASMGEQTLAGLDHVALKPTTLPPQRQAELQALFADMKERAKPQQGLRLELRDSQRIGPNAFALPAGVIVLTDDMVKLAQNDDEIRAVLAHEIGHVNQRHTLRNVLQSSAVALIISSLVGDLASITALAAAMPTLLMQTRYSRAFEVEADDYALAYMTANDIPLHHFADILLRMQKGHADEGVPDMLSTHPNSKERAARFGS